MVVFSKLVTDEFEAHASKLREAARARRDAVQLRAAVNDSSDGVAVNIKDTFGVMMPEDKWQGCCHLRTLRGLLSMVDDRGFERSPHQVLSASHPDTRTVLTQIMRWQMAFHDAFERTVSRVIYKKDWGTSRPAIMRHNNWPKCTLSTPLSYRMWSDVCHCMHRQL